ncbi:MAG: hypothetical protein COX65_08320 [Elusimicrobia bacterium CG_4_10_14_0_2_um_filter_56_8]|nr:MAG: hypothetical protein COX65_08320 [Elusimicrobia bacterium CG_4_10_14_0_2_um_filter_56_8]
MKTGKNSNLKTNALAVSVIMLLCAAPAFSGEYRALADKLAEAANANGISRIAMGAFTASAGTEEEARFASEKTAGLLSSGKGLEILDQAMLEANANPKKGWLAGLPAKLRPQAFIKGSVFKGEGDLTVMVKLVDAASGRVIGTMEMKSSPRFMNLPPVPEINWDTPVVSAPMLNDLRDAVADSAFDCKKAFREMTRVNAGAVDLKARYWAIKLKEKGFVHGSLTRNPGSELRDPQVKQKFYELLTKYHEQDSAPAIDRARMEKLEDFMGREDSVIDKCGIR